MRRSVTYTCAILDQNTSVIPHTSRDDFAVDHRSRRVGLCKEISSSSYQKPKSCPTVLLRTRIGFRKVLFQGPSYRSGGVTGQYWQPPSGSLRGKENAKWVTSWKSFNHVSTMVSEDGGEKGLLSLQLTARRSISSVDGPRLLRTVDPLPERASAMADATSGQVLG